MKNYTKQQQTLLLCRYVQKEGLDGFDGLKMRQKLVCSKTVNNTYKIFAETVAAAAPSHERLVGFLTKMLKDKDLFSLGTSRPCSLSLSLSLSLALSLSNSNSNSNCAYKKAYK